MKITDNRDAKRRLSLLNPGPAALPEATGWPRFAKKTFNSYAEMNNWKADLIREIMRRGGVRWKS
jgi:hypothetical protein